MSTIYVATSKGLSQWGADVGVTKHLYKLGLAEGKAEDAIKALNEAAHAGHADWKLLAKIEVEGDEDEAALIERLAQKERMIDPFYYPKIKGARGIFKVKLGNVENSLLVKRAMANAVELAVTIKPKDIAFYLIENALEPVVESE